MSVESMGKALQLTGLLPAEKLVLIGMANHDGDGGCWPSVATLARYACVSERRVQQLIDSLVEAGYVERVLNAGGTRETRDDRRPNLYRLHLQQRADGVQRAAPRDDDGVKPSAERGEAQGQHGVKPTSPEPSFNHPVTTSCSSDDERAFETWWNTWPKKVAKTQAEKAYWKAHRKVGESPLLTGAQAVARKWDALPKSERQFVPYPASWLNAERWNDIEVDNREEQERALYLSANYGHWFKNKLPESIRNGAWEGAVTSTIRRMLEDGYGEGETMMRMAVAARVANGLMFSPGFLKSDSLNVSRFQGDPRRWEDEEPDYEAFMQAAFENRRWIQQ